MYYTSEHTNELLRQSSNTDKAKLFKAEHVVFKPYSNVDGVISKAKMIGMQYREFKGIVAIYKKSVIELHAKDDIRIKSDSSSSGTFSNLRFSSIDFSNVDFSHVESMELMFRKSDIKHIDLSKADLSNVKSMYKAFEEFKTDTIDLSSKDFKNLVDMSYAFEGAITNTIVLDNSKFNKVTSIDNCFWCTNSNKISLRNVELNTIQHMNSICYQTTSKIVDFTNISANKLETIQNSFYSAVVERINLEFRDRTYIRYMQDTFRCQVQELKIKNLGIKGGGNISKAFQCCNTDELDLSDIIISNGVSAVGAFSSMTVGRIKLNKTFENLANIEELFAYTLTDELDLKSLDFKSAIMQGAFRFIKANKLDLSKCTFRNVVSTSEMFREAEIGELRLDKADMNAKCSMDWMFTDSRIQNIYINNKALSTVEKYSSALFHNRIQTKNIVN